MANIKRLDPGASPLHYFGAELRRLREAAGLTLDQLGGIVYLTGSMLGQIETATKTPKNEHVPRLDAALGAEGALSRAWELAKRHRLPGWYRRIAEMEATATQIRVFQAQLIHGLLQTEDYARAVLGVMRKDDLEEQVKARMKRQEILSRKDRPVFWAVLDEAVLYREVGGREVMRNQLAHLLGYAGVDEVQVQVLPFSAGAHPGLPGAMTLYSFDDQGDVAYTEGYEGGWASADSADIKARSLRYDLMRATALSPKGSAALITRVMEERYGDGSSNGKPHAVA